MQNLSQQKPLSLRFFFSDHYLPLLELEEICLCILHDIYFILFCIIGLGSFRTICPRFFIPCSPREKDPPKLMFWGFHKI